MPFLTVSTVGTSLLTNALRRDAPDRMGEVLDHANAGKDEIPDAIWKTARATVDKTVTELQDADEASARKASAELNGLLSFYEGRPSNPRDQHWLLATDTALGQVTADGVERILKGRGLEGVQTHTPRGLSAANTESLRGGVKQFLDWCERTLPGYRKSRYEIVFNLTGGFKSLQGILNTVGMFYADRMIYIFQTGPELVTIPRLPVQLNTDVFSKAPARFLRLAALRRVQGGTLPVDRFTDVPNTLIDAVEEKVYSFSEWGLLLWNRVRRALLEREDPFDLPHLDYTERFRKDVRKATPDQRRRLRETLAVASLLLDMHEGNTAPLKQHSALQYENYTGITTDDGRPIGHFRLCDDAEGRRVSCLAQNGGLTLRRFGGHDEVNENP